MRQVTGTARSHMRAMVVCMCAFVVMLLAPGAGAQQAVDEADLLDRPISDVTFTGAAEADLGLVRNSVVTSAGDRYDPAVVREDVNRMYRLGRFRFVTAEVELLEDGTVEVHFQMDEQPVIVEVQTTGNKSISDQELLRVVRQVRGGPRDDYLIDKAVRDITDVYREKGFYLTDVSVDDAQLERGVLIFQIIEGPRVRIRAIEFVGNDAFPDARLHSEIKTRTYAFVLRRGVLDEDILAGDVSALDQFYRGRGYLDVRVDQGVELSPDNREAKVTFYVEEGTRYVLGRIRTENLADPEAPLAVFSDAQIAGHLSIKTGDVYSADRLIASIDTLRSAYGGLGFADIRIVPSEERSGTEGVVNLLLEIDEGQRFNVGEVTIQGNFLTREKVVRRQLTFRPGRPLDSEALAESERRIRRTRLFGDARITVLEAEDVHPGYRDVLVEVKERNTGAYNFGVAIGSDSGAFGDISLNQSNFDIADVPASFDEFIRGRAFRGGGQRFSMALRPGDELFQYLVSLTEPHLFDSDYSLGGTFSYRERRFDEYDESRLTTRASIGRRLGDVWEGSLTMRGENVQYDEIAPSAPTEIFEDQGPDTITGVGLGLARTTIGTFTRPGSGSRFELDLEYVGALGGDFDFFRVGGEYTVFLTIDEDFLGRKSILKLNTRVARIFSNDERVPTYERFYLGGRSLRGFEFRTVSPKGIRNDNGQPTDQPVGGTWLFFAGAQYEFPMFEEVVTGAFFLDTGTVTDEVGFSDYRVAAGFGIRLYIDALGPVPIAFDFGFPISSEELDEEQVLSFSAELPFN